MLRTCQAIEVKHLMIRGSFQVLAGAIFLALVFSGLAQGQGFQSPTQMKGTWDIELWGGGVVAQHDHTAAFNTLVWTGGARFGRVLTVPRGQGWRHGTLEWDFGVVPVFVISHPAAHGFELDPLIFRWNFLRAGKRAPFVELAGGVAFTDSNVPPGTTSTFNFVPKFGYGWQFFTRPQRSFDVGLYVWHLSNAWLGRRNPSVNGLQLTMGYHWFKLQRDQQTGRDGPHESDGGAKP
jgi:hypothetical protein